MPHPSLPPSPQIVLLPVLAGVVLNQRYPATVARLAKFTPAIAALLIAVIVGTTLAYSAQVGQCASAHMCDYSTDVTELSSSLCHCVHVYMSVCMPVNVCS